MIANTLSITIAQRTREFATLRAVGATGRQVRRVVIIEGLVLGTFASLVGLFVGLALAKGLDALFKAFGADLPQRGLVFAWRTVIISMALGIIVTLLASLRPAVRATRVPPIAAVREGSILPPSRFARFGPIVALVVCAVSLALILYSSFGSGLTTGNRLILLGVGVLGFFIGVAMVAPSVARPLASVLGRPAQLIGGVSGTLARSNSMRNPGRTASTAAALMIGLALVTIVAVLAQGIKAQFEDAVAAEFHADYALTSQDGFTPTSTASAEALRQSGVATLVAGVRAGDGRVAGKSLQVAGVDPGISKVLKLNWQDGTNTDLDTLGMTGAILTKGYAKNHDLTVGSPIRLETPGAKYLNLRVHAIVAPPQGGSPLGTVTVSSQAFDSVYPNPQNVFTFVNTPGGVTPANTAKLNAVLDAYPDAKIQTQAEFIHTQEQGINQFLILLYVLLGLSIIVSLFGIVNTLILTVFERTREIGMLRAVGMTRRQTRRMIRHEAVITALLGAALGIPVGLVLAFLFDRALSDVPFVVPVGHADRLHHRRDHRRSPRGDLPGAARLEAERAQRAPVRVTPRRPGRAARRARAGRCRGGRRSRPDARLGGDARLSVLAGAARRALHRLGGRRRCDRRADTARTPPQERLVVPAGRALRARGRVSGRCGGARGARGDGAHRHARPVRTARRRHPLGALGRALPPRPALPPDRDRRARP